MDVSFLDEYDFLKILNREHKEEFEVTSEAISCYSQYFSIYSEENGWKKKQYSLHKNQMSTPGCWLQNSKETTIDIAGDILTTVSAFSGLEKIHPNLYKLFERVCHTIGNCVPWPEGGNLGGRPWKNGGSPDNYYRKILVCNDIMSQNVKYDTNCVRDNIAYHRTLGGSGFSSIQYWIDEVWKDKTWKEFVEINYLEDMVDENYNPIPFGLHGEKIDSKKLKDIYLSNIKMIICRGYRITNEGKLDEIVINEIYKKLGLE